MTATTKITHDRLTLIVKVADGDFRYGIGRTRSSLSAAPTVNRNMMKVIFEALETLKDKYPSYGAAFAAFEKALHPAKTLKDVIVALNKLALQKPAAAPKAPPSQPGKPVAKDSVRIKCDDGEWYGGTLTRVAANLDIAIKWDDGSTEKFNLNDVEWVFNPSVEDRVNPKSRHYDAGFAALREKAYKAAEDDMAERPWRYKNPAYHAK